MKYSTVYDALASGSYAFADLGAGSGGSLDHCTRRFKLGPGVGLELDPEFAEEGRRQGYDVFVADVMLERVPAASVRFVSMMDFLEHLPDEASAVAVLERFGRVAREFLFIRHPSFEDIDYLAEKGLKLCWTDWYGHPNMMLISDFVRAFERFGWNEYVVVPRQVISDSTSDQIVALEAPRDIVVYDPEKHGPKPFVKFDRPVYTQFDLVVKLDPDMDEAFWRELLDSDIGPGVAATWEATYMPPRAVPDPSAARERPGFYVPETSRWALRHENTSGEAEAELTYGVGGRGWLGLVGDFDGDGYDGIGVYDPSTGSFFLRQDPGEGEADVVVRFGTPDGVPIAGDWNGDGVDTIGLYYPQDGRWFLRMENESGDADVTFSFGPSAAGLVPVVGDWDGDGVDSVGLFDPETGTWHLKHAPVDGDADVSFTYGPPGAQPVVGDFDGDGRDSVGFYMPETGEWHLRNDDPKGPSDVVFTFRITAATPVVGRWRR